MIVYGAKSKVILSETLFEKCPNCGTSNSVQMHVIQKYAHVFWIPSFPTGKTCETECSHCKQVLKLKEMPDSFKEEYESLKTRSSTPVYVYSGLIVLVLLITFGVFIGNKNDRKNKLLIQSPQQGDVYEIRTKDNQYTLMKVQRVAGDIVYVFESEFETNKMSGLNDLKNKGDEAYLQIGFAKSKKELSEMLDNGEIMDVERK